MREQRLDLRSTPASDCCFWAAPGMCASEQSADQEYLLAGMKSREQSLDVRRGIGAQKARVDVPVCDSWMAVEAERRGIPHVVWQVLVREWRLLRLCDEHEIAWVQPRDDRRREPWHVALILSIAGRREDEHDYPDRYCRYEHACCAKKA